MQKTVMYFTNLRYQLHAPDSLSMHYGSVIRVVDRKMRLDLGDYFEISYYYVG